MYGLAMGHTLSLPTKTSSSSSSSSSSLISAKLDLGVEANVSTVEVEGCGGGTVCFSFFSGVFCVPKAKRRVLGGGGGAFEVVGGGVVEGAGKTFCK